MIINSLILNNYRNYLEEHFEFINGTNILIGDNGEGKTNVLEAIYMGSIGRSFRTNREVEVIKFNEEFASIDIAFDSYGRKQTINYIISNKNKKQIKLNGIKIKKLSELFGKIFVVKFSPDDMEIIKGEPSTRRKYIDIFLSQIKPQYVYNLSQYYKVLEQKNTLLKTDRVNSDELDIWNEKLADLNFAIAKDRQEVIHKIYPHFLKYNLEISDDKENVEINYVSQVKDLSREEIYQKLKEAAKNDIFKGHATIGIHRDDYRVIANDKDISKYGSQGQIRTAVLSLKLTERELIQEIKGEEPILLLDDVLSELDTNRKEFLINKISTCQVFITSTDLEKINLKENVKVIKINQGTIVN